MLCKAWMPLELGFFCRYCEDLITWKYLGLHVVRWSMSCWVSDYMSPDMSLMEMQAAMFQNSLPA
jgi:hypothetical protein